MWKEDSGSGQVQDIAAQVRGFGTGGAVTEDSAGICVTGELLEVWGDSHGGNNENIQSKHE